MEVVVQDEHGHPLALPVEHGREASFNWTEGLAALAGPGSFGASTSATINVSTLPAGTPIQVVARLVNNDADDGTSVVVRGVEFVPEASTPPAGRTPIVERESLASLVLSDLVDVSPGLVAVYGRTTLVDDEHLLAAEFSLRNDGAVALTGPLLVAIDNLSDPAVMTIDPDGRLPDGRPYWNLSAGESG